MEIDRAEKWLSHIVRNQITQKFRNRFCRQIASNQSSDELSRTDMPAIHNLARVRRVLIARQFLKELKHTHVLLIAEDAEARTQITKFLFVSKKGQKSQKDNCRLPSHSINQKISNLMHRTLLSPKFDKFSTFFRSRVKREICPPLQVPSGHHVLCLYPLSCATIS